MPFNTTDYKQPPYTNGVMDLTEKEILLVKGRLQEIADEFVPDMYNEQINTFYLTATYNRENPKECINGDTCEMVLAYQGETGEELTPEEEPQGE
jgi:hypothetical protein